MITSLPIVRRELRVAARRRSTYFNRVRAPVVAVLIGAWMLLVASHTPLNLGIVLFHTLAAIALISALAAGLGTTTDCLSEEKRENTLGFLFLTDLKGYDVVLGKLAATSLHALYGLVAIFPILAIPLLAGGITGAEVGRVSLAVLANVFFSLSVGMFCSAISREERKAAGVALAIVMLFTAGLPAAGSWLAEGRESGVNPVFLIPSPGYASFMAFDSTMRQFPKLSFFYPSILCVTGLGLLFLSAAAYVLPRTWQDAAGSPARLRWVERWHRCVFGIRPVRQALRTRLLDRNPYLWLAGRDRVKCALVWVFLAGIVLFWAYGALRNPAGWDDESGMVLSGLAWHTVLKIWLGTEACRRLVHDRKTGALELLLATPLAPGEIVRGQLLALWRQFAGPAMVVVLLDITFLVARAYDGEWVAMWLGWIIIFVFDMVTLSWLGMWMGLRSRNVNRAAGATLWRIMALPWASAIAIFTLVIFSNPRAFPAWPSEQTWIALAVLWGVLIDLAFLHSARRGLRDRFREMAAEPLDRRAAIQALNPTAP